jgi:valyl-tRNA synthetase
MNVPPGAQIPLIIAGANAEIKARAERHGATLSQLARLSSLGFADPAPKGAVQIVTKAAILALPLAEIIDLKAEGERLKREIEKLTSELAKLDQKLSDEKFTGRAPEHVVEENRDRRVLKRLEAAA